MKLYTTYTPLVELTKRIFKYRNLSVQGILLLPVYYLKLLLVMPGAMLQKIIYSKKISSVPVHSQPIFILGHYRSGTTLLHKLLASDERFGYISYYDILCPNTGILFGKWLQSVLRFIITKLKLKTAFFNNSIPSLAEPAEEERFLINKGSAYTDYWRFVFPQSWKSCISCAIQCSDENYYSNWSKEYLQVLKLASYKHKGKQLVLKSPENTGRIKYLLRMFPNAKFIYISRNPFDVYYSMMNLWKKAIRKFCLQNISDEAIEEIIFSHYCILLDQYEKEKSLIPAGNLVEVKFDELESNPLHVLKTIYASLSIPGFKNVQHNLNQKIEQENQYHKFEYTFSAETFRKIENRWSKYIEQWNKNDLQHKHIAHTTTTVQECDATEV